jgi:hypothetical protein
MATMARGMSAFLSLLPNTLFELLLFLSPMPLGVVRSEESGVRSGGNRGNSKAYQVVGETINFRRNLRTEN